MTSKREIPNNWKMVEFGDFVTRSSSRYNPKKNNEHYKCIELEHLQESTGHLLGYTDVSNQKSTKNHFKKGQILFGKLRPYLKKYWNADFEGVCSSEIWVLDTKGDECKNSYLFYLIQTHRFNQIANVSSGTKMPRADWSFISDYPFPLPPLNEQEEIINVINTWDKAISKTEKLIQAKKRYKKGLMQRLLSGKVRFPGFEGEWVEVKLGSLLKESKRMDDWDDEKLYELISVRRRSGGIFHRENLYGHEIKTKKLKQVKVEDFLISRMQIVHGASAVVTPEFEDLYVSNSYHTLVKRDGKALDMAFFDYISQLPYFYHLSYVSSYGVHIEKMTFNLKDFLKKKVRIPKSEAEQQKIASTLKQADKEIGLLETQKQNFEKQKKGLMQKLLTGKVRVTNLEAV